MSARPRRRPAVGTGARVAVAAGTLVAVAAACAGTEGEGARLEPHVFEARDGDTVHAQLGRFRVPLRRDGGGPAVPVPGRGAPRDGEGPARDGPAAEGAGPAPDSLELAFVRFPATSPDPGPPIVYLAGGPGGSGIAAARGSRGPLFMALREFGDVIALDQRGTGMSEGPSPATCPVSRPYPPQRPLEREPLRDLTLAVARACGEFWRERGVDLAAYNTRESADDVAALAAALSSPELRLWAISYGTHLALATIRRHPELVERAILAGVEGPDHTIKLPSYWSGQLDALERLIRAEPDAAAEFPDLRGLMAGVLERLDREPAPVELIGADGADTVRSSVTGFTVRRRTIDLLRDPSTMVTVPHLYRRMAAGDVSPLGGSAGAGGLSAMQEATDAASGMSPGRRARFLDQDSTTLLGGGDELTNADMAEALGVPDLGDAFRAPVRSDVPVLFISGTLDGRTPAANAEEVLSGFPNGRHLVIENAGHSDDLFLSSPAILEAMRAFLAGRPVSTRRPTAEPPRLADGRLPPSLPAELTDAVVGAYARGPADVWRIVPRGTVRSLDARGRETGRTTALGVRIRGNGFPLVANQDTTFGIAFPGADLRFRFVRDADGRVTRLDFTGSGGETVPLFPVRWEEVAFVEGGHWLLAGPFRLETGESCARAFPPEDALPGGSDVAGGSERAGASDGGPGDDGEWRRGTGDDGFVDFEESFGGATVGGVGYAYISLVAPAAMPAQLLLGSDDDARVVLNGAPVHAFDGAREAWEAQDTVRVRLRAGENPLLVKVCNRDSDWRFNLRITDERGASLVTEAEAGLVRLRASGGS